jgi:xylan 1,4-beta-xylosidase
VYLRITAQGGSHYRFAFSPDGRTWTELLPETEAANGQFLPPWDRGVRVGIIAQGPTSATAVFERFELVNK